MKTRRALTKPLAPADITAIISAGKLANCSQIAYNGLVISYNPQPQSVVVDATLTPWTHTPHNPAEGEQFTADAHNNAHLEQDMDTLMVLDPVAFEEQIQSEGRNAKS